MNIFITGLGVISGIGADAVETLSSIRRRETGIGRLSLFESAHRDSVYVSEVKRTDTEMNRLIGLPDDQILSRTSLLGMKAVGEALADAGITEDEKKTTALISSTSTGGMDLSEGFYRRMKAGRKARLRYIVSHDCGDSTEQIASHYGLSHLCTTVSTACSSAANAIMFGARLIRQGLADRVVAGGTDALTLFTLNGFRSLMILDPAPCRPFDNTRAGLNLGEGAGYVVLESEQSAVRSGRTPYCRLAGYGNANDAYHQTASSPEGNGPFSAMSKALASAGLLPDAIDYINAHGTGTPNNDLSEGRAMTRLFGDNMPAFSSTKAYTGHTLGATGGIEAVLSALAIRHGWVYPNLHFSQAMDELPLTPQTQLLTGVPLNHVLSSSFGFGGNCTALVFSKAWKL
jgi:3-oxoacyl-[acyl-carrier-protein] synthase-1